MKRYSFPISCEWNITNYCNLKCHFCSMGCEAKKDFDLLDIHKIRYVARNLKELGCIYVSLSGGEPMSHPLFLQIVEELRKNNLEVTLTTNGTYINEKMLNKLQDYGVRWIQVSLHSRYEEKNDEIMGSKAYSKIMRTINLVKKSEIGISVCSVVTEQNEEDVDELHNVFINEGIQHHCKKLLKVGRAKHSNDTTISKYDNDNLSKDKHETCSMFFAIMPNGDIQPCGEFKAKIGNIFYDDIKKLWGNNPIFGLCRSKSLCLAEEYENDEEIQKEVQRYICK